MARKLTGEIVEIPRSDVLDGTTHPRAARHLIGHEAAEQVLSKDFNAGRLAQGWLFTGPKGIGKATLAYKFAKQLLSTNDPTGALVVSGGHPGLLSLTRPYDDKKKKLSTVITVDEVRRTTRFFGTKAAKGSWRICIVDAADEMNPNAANALLKILEEPPGKCCFILISHAPGRLLPTIRSRCRVLALRNLSDHDTAQVLAEQSPDMSESERMILARLSDGSPGAALALAADGGIEQYRNLIELLGRLPSLETKLTHSIADTLSRAGTEQSFHTFTQLLRDWLARMIRTVAANETPVEIIDGEAEMMLRIASAQPLDRWIEIWEKTGHILERTDAVHLDRKLVLLNIFSELETATSSLQRLRA